MVFEVMLPMKGTERAKRYMQKVAVELRNLGYSVRSSYHYTGAGKVLFLYGPGAADRRAARIQQTAAGRHTVMFDIGYFDRPNYMRVSITKDHPQAYFDETPNDSRRWDKHGIQLTEVADPKGPIILVGLGRKSRGLVEMMTWEVNTAEKLRKEFPSHRILYRPKPGSIENNMDVGLETIPQSVPIQEALKGASLVVCRHSNVALDAAIAGVPYRCEDGAAAWLNGKPYTPENRLDLLRRASFWQWREEELKDCLVFIINMVRQLPAANKL